MTDMKLEDIPHIAMTTAQAASEWNMNQDYIKQLCQKNEVLHIKLGSMYLIDRRQPNPRKK